MSLRRLSLLAIAVQAAMIASPPAALAQTFANLRGRILDSSGAALPDALVSVRAPATGFEVSTRAAADGRYYIGALPSGGYRVVASASGFRAEVIEELKVDVGRALVRDFRLGVGGANETVVVRAELPLVDRATSAVGQVVPDAAVALVPLNGRHFADLAMLAPGAVAPSQAGFSTTPIRGVGALAINIAGNREESVGFVLNGISTNNLTFGSLIYEPPVSSIEEFRVDTSGYSAEFGHVGGAVINIVTRSGADRFAGELFEFVRNDLFDARNFFELASDRPHPFTRNQFGGSLGGPLRRGQTHFFAAYEGLRQRQGVDLNSLVLSDEQRDAVTDPVVRRLLRWLPRANLLDAGAPRFVGSAAAVADMDRWTLDLRHSAGVNDRFQLFYGSQEVDAVEPLSQGTTVPGFGNRSRPARSALTLGETHVFSSGLVNEVRAGRVRLEGGTYPANAINPADLGIDNGVSRAIGLPQISVAGGLTFGGPGTLPMGRFDTSYVVNDTLSRSLGAHGLRFGGEYRHFINENFAEGTGVFNFPSIAAFMSGTANAFNITLGERHSLIDQRAMGLFVQDRVAVNSRLSLDVGLRYDWHVTPTERHDRFVVFDAPSSSLLRLGVDRQAGIYRQNNRNVEPRLGAVWDVTGDGRTVLRAAYSVTADEPGTTAVRDTAANPPFASPLTAAGSISLSSAIATTRPGGLAPATVDPGFQNATMRAWNVNLQRQLTADMAVSGGLTMTQGRHLRLSRNINQPMDGSRPFPAISAASPILPGVALGNITQVESSGYSNYRGGWISLTRRLSRDLQFDTSYTWSRSLDTNSLNSSGFALQNAYDIAAQYGPSDFDSRHRLVLNAIYTGPTGGHLLTRGWQFATVVQAQSGNPVNIVTSNSALTGIANTVRPDLVAPLRVIGSVNRWFDPSSFAAVNRFGTLPRNAVVGPAFHSTDVSVIRNASLAAGTLLQLRLDVFDLFNHPNFGPPGNIVGSPTFGAITRTRLPTGEAGSSRQIQLAAKLMF
jgi:hypothetical protein